MRSLVGVEVISDGLAPMKPILETWAELVQNYSNAFPQEGACYWFNERANISMLAAAAWKTEGGWMALEEYSTYKHGEDAALKNGRCDLWLTKPSEKDSYAIEAKQVWQGIGELVSDKYQRVRDGVKRAWQDASKLHKTEAKTRLAACFIVPSLPASQADGENYREGLAEWLKGLREKEPHDAMAWVFPESSSALKASERIYPGVCLLLKIRLRAVRTSRAGN